MGRLSTLFSMILVLGLVNPVLLRSQTGHIIGAVTDSTGSPIAYANVILVGTRLGAMTLRNGAFVISRVPVGRYSLKVLMMGHFPVEKHDIPVRLGETTKVDFTLKKTPLDTTTVVHRFAPRGSETYKSRPSVSLQQLELRGVYPDTLPRVRSLGLEFQARYILTPKGDSIAVKIVVEGRNCGDKTIRLCGVYSFLELPYRVAPEILAKHLPLGGKWEYPGPVLEIGSRTHLTPRLTCESFILQPGSSVTDTLVFSYRANDFARWPGEVRFRCLFFHGDDGDPWEDTKYVDLGVITVPIRSSI